MTSRWKAIVPAWITLPLLAAIVVGALVLVGNIKSYLDPISSLSTIYRPKPVPVAVEKVKWLTKVKTVQVSVPVEVIHEVEKKEAARLDKDFGIKLDLLHDQNKELATVLSVPRAPHGGEMAITVNTLTGKTEGIFRPQAAPFIEFGGLREVGVDYEPLGKVAGGYYRQDLVRLGPAIVNGKVFAKAPISPGASARGLDYGVSIGVAVRF